MPPRPTQRPPDYTSVVEPTAQFLAKTWYAHCSPHYRLQHACVNIEGNVAFTAAERAPFTAEKVARLKVLRGVAKIVMDCVHRNLIRALDFYGNPVVPSQLDSWFAIGKVIETLSETLEPHLDAITRENVVFAEHYPAGLSDINARDSLEGMTPASSVAVALRALNDSAWMITKTARLFRTAVGLVDSTVSEKTTAMRRAREAIEQIHLNAIVSATAFVDAADSAGASSSSAVAPSDQSAPLYMEGQLRFDLDARVLPAFIGARRTAPQEAPRSRVNLAARAAPPNPRDLGSAAHPLDVDELHPLVSAAIDSARRVEPARFEEESPEVVLPPRRRRRLVVNGAEDLEAKRREAENEWATDDEEHPPSPPPMSPRTRLAHAAELRLLQFECGDLEYGEHIQNYRQLRRNDEGFASRGGDAADAEGSGYSQHSSRSRRSQNE